MRRLLVIPILLIGALLALVAGTAAGNNDFVCDELVNGGTFDNVTVAKGGVTTCMVRRLTGTSRTGVSLAYS